MSSKRGQIHSEFIRIFIIATIIVLISYFGYRGFSKISEATCKSELVLFEKDLQVAAKEMSSQTGSVEERKYKVPCNVERMYFFDLGAFFNLSEDIAALSDEEQFEPLRNYYEIKESILAGAEKNVFLIKDNKVAESFNMGDIILGPPYYDCYITKQGILNIYFEGKKGKASILKKDAKFDCAFTEPVPVILSEEDLKEVLEEIGGDVTEVSDCNIERNISKKEGSTEIKITKKGEACIYFENIPKCAVESISDAIEDGKLEVPEGTVVFADDPVIMWDFGVGDEFTYELLNKIIEEACKRKFKGSPEIKDDVLPEVPPRALDIIDGLRVIIDNHIEKPKRKETAYGYLDMIEKKWHKPRRVKKLIENLEKLFKKSGVTKGLYEELLEELEKLSEGGDGYPGNGGSND